MKKTIITFILLSFSMILNAQTETLKNSNIIEMKKSKLSKTIIINAIENSDDFNFDISTNGLKQLSDNKIDDEIVLSIMKKQKNKLENIITINGVQFNKNEYGLFVIENNQKIQIVSHLTQVQFGMKIKANIPNVTSDITLKSDVSTFYFNINKDENGPTNTTFNLNNSISDPNEGELIKLSKVSKKREIQVGKANMGGIKTEIPEKARIEYTVEKIKLNFYKLTLKNKLEAGEYGFIFGAINGGASMKIYDFTIK